MSRWKPTFNPSDVVAEFSGVLNAYGVSRVTGDRYGGEWPRERFREQGITYEPATLTKSEYYLELLPLVNSRRVELLGHPRLIAQLAGLERRTGRTGRDTVDHAPGSHDDVINAVAGALVCQGTSPWRVVSALLDEQDAQPRKHPYQR